MTFLVRFGFIVGWTVLIATFLSQIGIGMLPALFLGNALLVMFGTLIFRKFVHKVRKEVLITFTVICAAALLISSIAFINTNSLYFFTLLLITESVLLAQLSILLSLFNEEIFSPLESQRTFPIIESAETIGGIAGGLVLGLLSQNIAAYKFIIIWAVALLLILPIILKYNKQTLEVPSLEEEKVEEKKPKQFHASIGEMRKTPFLKGLMLVILLQWAMMNIVEFQYTKAVQQDVYSQQEETIVMDENGEENIILASEAFTDAVEKTYEREISKKLGYLHIIFNSAALGIQLILASRIIMALGIVSSMLLHPLVAFLNFIALTLRFSFLTAALTRGSYELTNVIFKNAYDSSYYAVPHHKRDEVKEVMQGLIKPAGAILGTVLIIIVAMNAGGTDQTLILNAILIFIALISAVLIYKLGRKYTSMSEQNLSRKIDLPTRLNAIEILAQRGHEDSTQALQGILARKQEPEIVKKSILETLGEREDTESIDIILQLLHDKKTCLRLAAAQALGKFDNLKKEMKSRSFTRHRVIETLKEVLKKEKESTVKEVLINTYFQLAPSSLTEFLLETIQKKNKQSASFIRMLRLFEDPNLKFYLEPYLESKDPELRGSGIVALWRFKELQGRLKHYLRQMLASKKTAILKAGIITSGQVQFKEAKSIIKSHINHKDSEIKHAALIALAQMEDESAIPHITKLLTDPSHEWFKKTEEILTRFPKKIAELTEAAMHLEVIGMINKILKGKKSFKKMELKTLVLLQALYKKIKAHHEERKIKLHLDSPK